MNKKILIEKYADLKGLSKKEATEVIESVIGLIANGIEDEGKVDLFGFGKFVVETVPERTRKYTMGDKKGQEYTTPEHRKVKFKAAKALVESVNE